MRGCNPTRWKGGGCAVAALLLSAGCSGSDAPPQMPETASASATPQQAAQPAPGEGEYLSSMYGVEPREAARRQANEQLVGTYSASLHDRPLPGYSDIWIRHTPTYAVVVNVKLPFDRAAFIARAPAELHQDLEFAAVRHDRREVEVATNRILESFRGLPGAWSGGYEVQTDTFRFTVASEAMLEPFRNAVPADLRDVTSISVGPQPVPLVSPAISQP